MKRHILFFGLFLILFSFKLLSFNPYFTGYSLSFNYNKSISCLGGSLKSEYLYGSGRSCIINFISALIEHCANFSLVYSGNKRIAYFKCSFLNENRSGNPASFIQL